MANTEMNKPRLYPDCLRTVNKTFDEYVQIVEDAPYKISTKHTYIQHAQRFVRWLNGEDAVPEPVPNDE